MICSIFSEALSRLSRVALSVTNLAFSGCKGGNFANACAEVIKSYNDIKREYNRPPERLDKNKYVREKFSDEENKRINEIFNFYDDDDTIH